MADRAPQHGTGRPTTDRITTTEGVRLKDGDDTKVTETTSIQDMTGTEVGKATSIHPPGQSEGEDAAELTIIEPDDTLEVDAASIKVVDAMMQGLEGISKHSLALPNSEHLSTMMASVHLALRQAETLKLYLQGHELPA